MELIERKRLIEKVSIVFHVAATVLFFECIADSLKMNVRGTYDLLELARSMKQLKVRDLSYPLHNREDTDQFL